MAVPENQGEKALGALESAFELELARSTVNSGEQTLLNETLTHTRLVARAPSPGNEHKVDPAPTPAHPHYATAHV